MWRRRECLSDSEKNSRSPPGSSGCNFLACRKKSGAGIQSGDGENSAFTRAIAATASLPSATRLKMDLYRWAQEKPVLDKAAARRAVWEPLSELVEASSWSKTVSDMTKNMTPEQEAKFREFIRVRPTPVHEPNY